MQTYQIPAASRKKKVIAAGLLLIMAFLLVLGATLAYFTDQAITEATVKAGKVDISAVLQLFGIAEDGTSLASPVFGNVIEGWSPGDHYAARWTLSNTGDKSARVSNNIVLSMTRTGGFPASVTADSISSLVRLANASVTDKNSQQIPVTLKFVSAEWNADNNAFDVTYRLSDVSVQGTSETNPLIDGAPGPLMIRTDLVFDSAAGDAYQGMVATLTNTTNAVQARGASGSVNALMP